VSDLQPQFLPLAQQLNRRLDLRLVPLQEIISGIRNSCAARGLGASGALIKQVLAAFQTEIELRLETIERALRLYRLSCSPSLIVQNKGELCELLDRLVAQQCQYTKYECEQAINPVLSVLGDSSGQMRKLCEQRFTDVTRTFRGLMEGIAQEIIMGAKSDLEATKKEERPSYVFHNTIQGSVGAFAQGGSTIGQVLQSNNPGAKIDEILRLVKAASADWTQDEKRQVDGATAMLVAGAQAEEPDNDLLRATVSKIGIFAMGVAQSVATQSLIAYLKQFGLLPPNP
jgi:hypothetical protein